MKKQLRRWTNRYKNQRKKRKLELSTGLDLASLTSSCEAILLKKVNKNVYTKFRDLGGANNHGMLLHYSTITNELVAISKIEEQVLAEREHRFLTWQENYRENVLAATSYGISSIADKTYACLISSVLNHPQDFSYIKAECLFKRMGESPELVSSLSLDGCKEHLAHEITSSTKIKSILTNVVSKFQKAGTEDYISKFLLDRKILYSSNELLLNQLHDLMLRVYGILSTRDLSDYEGLVHGDYKAQNILEDKGRYKVIDCQYYTYGIRLWDLAFLYSKEAGGFEKIKDRIYAHSLPDEKLLLLFFYILASLISVKKKRAKKVLEYKIIPAVNYLTHLISASDGYE